MNCGPGKDTAVADKLDRISTSCEVVTGLPKPALSIADASGVEGNSGTETLSFEVTLSTVSTKPVAVGYATTDGTAASASDYTAASGTLTFQPGEKAKTIAISVVADTTIEQDETFSVTLSNPVNASSPTGRPRERSRTTTLRFQSPWRLQGCDAKREFRVLHRLAQPYDHRLQSQRPA